MCPQPPGSTFLPYTTLFRSFLGLRVERRRDRRGEAVPAVGLLAQALAPGGGQLIKLGAPIVVGGAPAGLEQTLPDQPKQGRVKCALLDEQRPLGDLFDAKQNAVTVERAERNGLENQKTQRPGKDLRL